MKKIRLRNGWFMGFRRGEWWIGVRKDFGCDWTDVCRCGLTWTDEQPDAQPLPFVVEPIHRPDPWGIWPLVLIIAVVAAIVGLAVEVWR